MATVTRRYVFEGADAGELVTVVDPSASVINGSKAWTEIEYDDTISGITDALDEFMGSFGFTFDANAGKDGIRVRSPDGTDKDIKVDDAGNVFVGGFPVPGIIVIRVPLVAGTPGTPDDVVIYNANSPALRILDTVFYVSASVALATVTLRDATGGGGNALSDAFATSTVGVRRNVSLTATGTIAINGTLVLRRSDRGVAGEAVIYARPE